MTVSSKPTSTVTPIQAGDLRQRGPPGGAQAVRRPITARAAPYRIAVSTAPGPARGRTIPVAPSERPASAERGRVELGALPVTPSGLRPELDDLHDDGHDQRGTSGHGVGADVGTRREEVAEASGRSELIPGRGAV
jgi:hypothetical protein